MTFNVGKYAIGFGLGIRITSYKFPTFELDVCLGRFYLKIAHYRKATQ